MAKNNGDSEYRGTVMGDMVNTLVIKPISAAFCAVSRRAEKTFWAMNDTLNGGVRLPDDDRKKKDDFKPKG